MTGKNWSLKSAEDILSDWKGENVDGERGNANIWFESNSYNEKENN